MKVYPGEDLGDFKALAASFADSYTANGGRLNKEIKKTLAALLRDVAKAGERRGAGKKVTQ